MSCCNDVRNTVLHVELIPNSAIVGGLQTHVVNGSNNSWIGDTWWISCHNMRRSITVNDRMQRDYRYELVEPVGRNFDPEFKPDLTPAEMLRLGVFGGKYMTDCANEFPASWFKHAKLASGSAIIHSTTSASKPVSRSPNGAGRDGYIRTIHAAGSNGTAATTWVDECSTKTIVRSNAGRQSADTSDSFACLRARRSVVPQTATAGAPALGLRQP